MKIHHESFYTKHGNNLIFFYPILTCPIISYSSSFIFSKSCHLDHPPLVLCHLDLVNPPSLALHALVLPLVAHQVLID
jgi:hypothetical protein